MKPRTLSAAVNGGGLYLQTSHYIFYSWILIINSLVSNLILGNIANFSWMSFSCQLRVGQNGGGKVLDDQLVTGKVSRKDYGIICVMWPPNQRPI